MGRCPGVGAGVHRSDGLDRCALSEGAKALIRRVVSSDGVPLVKLLLADLEQLLGRQIDPGHDWLPILLEDDGQHIVVERGSFILLMLLAKQA